MKHIDLPELCYQELDCTKELIIIKRGETGYFPCNFKGDYKLLNQRLGVTEEQAMAMKVGSMFGWHTKGADPNNYKNGKLNLKGVEKNGANL